MRDLYAGPALPNSAMLTNDKNALQARCTNELSASPPRYETCTPPPGATVSAEDWTAVSNEIVAEPYWALAVLDYFADTNAILTDLFLNENGTLPNLELNEAANNPVRYDYQALFRAHVAKVISLVPKVGAPLSWVVTQSFLTVGSITDEDASIVARGLEMEMRHELFRHRLEIVVEQLQHPEARGQDQDPLGPLQDRDRAERRQTPAQGIIRFRHRDMSALVAEMR